MLGESDNMIRRTSTEPMPSALRRLEVLLHSGPANTWDAPSQFGIAGTTLRRLLRRVLRPYETRQREFDAALLDIVREIDRDAAGDHSALALAAPLVADAVVEAETPVGVLWAHADDRVTTPALQSGAEWEPALSAFLRERLKPGMTYIDVGANIGYFTLMGARLVGERGRVAAVECEPGNLMLLRANLWRNGVTVLVLPVAAYSRRGHVALLVNNENRGGTALALEWQPGPLVPCAPLDDLLAEWVPDVVKVDVEGTDHLAIAGMEMMLKRNHDVLVVTEFFPNVSDLHGTPPAEVLDSYEAAGFALHLLGGSGELVPADRDAISREGERHDYFSIVLRRGSA
jgi:FkbM family methyltransferase